MFETTKNNPARGEGGRVMPEQLGIRCIQLLLEKDYHRIQLEIIASEKRRDTCLEKDEQESVAYWRRDIDIKQSVVHYIEDLMKQIHDIRKESTPSR